MDDEVTGGKALVFAATTEETLVGLGGRYAIELRGVDSGSGADFEKPDVLADSRCRVLPCEWTVAPETAGDYEFRAFLVEFQNSNEVSESSPVKVSWAAPTRPVDLELLVNGKRLPHTALVGNDAYTPVPLGPLRVKARWKNDATGTGYKVVISTAEPRQQVYAICTTDMSCSATRKEPIRDEQEVSWQLELVTTQGEKVVEGFKVCLVGRA